MTVAMMLKCPLSRQRAGRSTVETASRNVEGINSGYLITQFINLPIFLSLAQLIFVQIAYGVLSLRAHLSAGIVIARALRLNKTSIFCLIVK